MDTSYKNITEKAIRAVSNPHAVARLFNFRSAESVYKWIKNNRVPSSRVIELCRLGNWVVTPNQLRPDIHPNPTSGIPENTVINQKESDS